MRPRRKCWCTCYRHLPRAATCLRRRWTLLEARRSARSSLHGGGRSPLHGPRSDRLGRGRHVGHEGYLVSRSHTRRSRPRNAVVGRFLRAIRRVAKADKKEAIRQENARNAYLSMGYSQASLAILLNGSVIGRASAIKIDISRDSAREVFIRSDVSFRLKGAFQ